MVYSTIFSLVFVSVSVLAVARREMLSWFCCSAEIWCAKLFFIGIQYNNLPFMQQNTKLFNQTDSPRTLNTHSHIRTFIHWVVVCCIHCHEAYCNVFLTAHWFNEIWLPLPFSPFQLIRMYKLDRIFRASFPCHSLQSTVLPNSALH